MRSLVVFVVLMLVALAAPAQRVVKCTQPDGSVAYQQTDCAASAASEAIKVAPQPIMSTRTERRFVVSEDRNGNKVRAWTDVSVPDGPTYTTRELQRVKDRDTGQWTEAWVDVQHAVPQPPPVPVYRTQSRTPAMPPRAQTRERQYYQPSDRERRRNSQYEKARCMSLPNAPQC